MSSSVELAESTFFVAKPLVSNQLTFDHRPSMAYDIKHDVTRYEELVSQGFSDQDARRTLLEEMKVDLTTHFAELNRVGAFSYRYLIQDEILVEDSSAQKSVRSMFEKQDGTIAKLWLEFLIPSLEQMPVGSYAFTYSARQDGKYEGAYDYAYLFQKVDDSTIHATGLELVLTKPEQASILNKLYFDEEKPLLLLTDNPSADEVRSRAFIFSPQKFTSTTDAFSKIIGQVIEKTKSDWKLTSPEDYQHYFDEQEQKLILQQAKSARLATSIVNKINNVPIEKLEQELSKAQIKDLLMINPDLLIQAYSNNLDQILVACGFISLNSFDNDLRFTAGQNLVETQTSWEYHTGYCQHCHTGPTEVGPCDICKQCEKIL